MIYSLNGRAAFDPFITDAEVSGIVQTLEDAGLKAAIQSAVHACGPGTVRRIRTIELSLKEDAACTRTEILPVISAIKHKFSGGWIRIMDDKESSYISLDPELIKIRG